MSTEGRAKGGRARADSLPPERRREIAQAAAKARWAGATRANKPGLANVPPMTAKQFFAEVARLGLKPDLGLHLRLSVWKIATPQQWNEDALGFGATAGSIFVYGDTANEAIRAAFDCLSGLPPRRSRLCPAYFENEQRDPSKARRVAYDYRAKDWEPPK